MDYTVQQSFQNRTKYITRNHGFRTIFSYSVFRISWHLIINNSSVHIINRRLINKTRNSKVQQMLLFIYGMCN